MWDLAEGTLLTELKGHSDTVYSLSFSRDGNILASGQKIFFSNTVAVLPVTLENVISLKKTLGFTHMASSLANVLQQKKVFP